MPNCKSRWAPAGLPICRFHSSERSGLRIDDGAPIAGQDDTLAARADDLSREYENRLAVHHRPARARRNQRAVVDLDRAQ